MARPVPNVLEALGVWPAGPLGRLLRAGWSRLASGLARTLWLRATLALFGVYVVLLPAGLLVAGQQGQAAGAADRAARLGRVQVDLRALQTGVFEESAGLRGYIETTDARLLDQYDAGRARLGRAWASLAVDASGTVLERELPALRATSDAWQEWAARNRGTVVAAPRPAPGGARLGEGEILLDRLVAAAARLEGLASGLASRADAEADQLLVRGLVAGTIGPIVGSAALVVLGSALLWLVLRPVRTLARAANRLAGGLEPEIPYAWRRDEVGAVARALVSWRRAAASQRLIWQHIPCAMLVFGADLIVRQVNPAQLTIFRPDPRLFTDHEYMTTAVANATHPDDMKATARMYGRLLSGKSGTERLEKRYIRSDGSVFWGNCILTLVRDDEGEPDHFVCMIQDISERRERLERAARVQRELLPDAPPELEGYELAGLCRPSQEVGGDFFDWRQEPGRLTLTLGDVMGKDMPAALLMATVSVALRTSARRSTVGEAVRSVAASIERDLDGAGAFVTLFHGRLDLETGVLRYVDAGHGLAVIVGDGGVRHLAGRGSLPLGVVAGEEYGESSVRLRPGEALLVFSDGVLDVHPKVEETLEAAGELMEGAGSAQEMAERLASGPGTAADDVTVLVVRRHPAP